MQEDKAMSKKEQKLEFEHATIYQTNENCQVFTGPISGAIFAMPGSTVHQHVGNAEKKAEATEAEVVEEVNEGNIVMEEFPVPQALSASRQALSTKLKDLARKGDWQSPASVERVEGVIDVLMADERFCGLLENGRGDRVRIVWQNLVGYFAEKGFFPCGKGSPALNKMFFGASAEDYQNIDKGRKTATMSEGFKAIVPLLEELLA